MVGLSKNGMLITNICLILLSIALAVLFLMFPYIKEKNKPSLKEYLLNNKDRIFVSALLLVGFVSRLAFLDLLPGGLNQDEASAGYDAYAIMKYGIDRNGNPYPVHLVSWGSGQNALYSYICIPMIFILGVNETSLRLPMAIIGCVSLYVLYKILNKRFNSKTTIFGLFFLVICPWHIMKSRWGLESNLFPDLVFIGTYFLFEYLSDKKLRYLIISSIILGLSAYSYGTSYFFLFFFVIGYLIYLLIRKEITIKHSIITLSIIGIISIPIILFLYVNLFDKETINFLWFSIPKLNVDRFQDVTNIYSDSFFESAKENMKNALYLLFNQYDGLPWNGIPYFGHVYLISIPFALIGLFNKNEKNKSLLWIFRIWLIVAVLMLLIVSPNTNRINIIFFPIIVFAIFGLVELFELSKKFEKILIPSYMIFYLVFSSYYATEWNNNLKANFYYGLGESITFVDRMEDKNKVFVSSNINMPYIFVLYYTEYDVNEYIETVSYYNENGAFEMVKSFGDYNFYLPYNIVKGNVYIVSVYDNTYEGVDLSSYNVTYFGYFYVIDARK